MIMSDEYYMQRCFDLAWKGIGKVTPNPMVGAVLVHEGRIIGEGYHRAYGQAHAEVNALESVADQDRALLPASTLYISLEPCCFHGKTPPCTDLIIRHRIPRVVISVLDDTPEVAGKGVAQLRAARVEVVTGILAAEGRRLSRPRSVFVLGQRPYVILKYARSRNRKFAPAEPAQQWITRSFSKRLVHKWRSETDAILVGTRTARIDDPQLTNRLYFGGTPLRVVLDRRLQLPSTLSLFQGEAPTLLVSARRPTRPLAGLEYLQLDFGDRMIEQLLHALFRRRIGTLLVEGGRSLLESFLEAGLWDEARVLTGELVIPDGIPAPEIDATPALTSSVGDGDQLEVYYNDVFGEAYQNTLKYL